MEKEFPSFDGYKLTGLLGEGGMGLVYCGFRLNDGLQVAIKVVRSKLNDASDIGRQRFQREIDACKQFAHPYVVKVIDGSSIGENPFLAMELLNGETLAQRVKKGPLSFTKAEQVFRQAAQGLQYVHGLSLLHRDVKPSNIFLDRNERAVLIDFGLAYFPEKSRLTKEGTTVGSYMALAPEILQGQAPCRSADIYGLGVSMYKATTGKLPFSVKQVFCLSKGVRLPAPPPPDKLNQDIPVAFSNIIMNCIAVEAKNRYATVDSVLSELHSFSKGAEVALVDDLARRAPSLKKSKRRKGPKTSVRSYLILGISSMFLLLVTHAYFEYNSQIENEALHAPAGNNVLSSSLEAQCLSRKGLPNTTMLKRFGETLVNKSTEENPISLALLHLAPMHEKNGSYVRASLHYAEALLYSKQNEVVLKKLFLCAMKCRSRAQLLPILMKLTDCENEQRLEYLLASSLVDQWCVEEARANTTRIRPNPVLHKAALLKAHALLKRNSLQRKKLPYPLRFLMQKDYLTVCSLLASKQHLSEIESFVSTKLMPAKKEEDSRTILHAGYLVVFWSSHCRENVLKAALEWLKYAEKKLRGTPHEPSASALYALSLLHYTYQVNSKAELSKLHDSIRSICSRVKQLPTSKQELAFISALEVWCCLHDEKIKEAKTIFSGLKEANFSIRQRWLYHRVKAAVLFRTGNFNRAKRAIDAAHNMAPPELRAVLIQAEVAAFGIGIISQ